MSAERESLKRFLLIYVFSTLLLVGTGEWFYYKSKYHAFIDSEVSQLRNELRVFLAENKGLMRKFIISGKVKINGGLKIAFYKNSHYLFGNFHPSYVNFDKEFWINGGSVYYVFNMPKRWGRIDVVVMKKIDKEKLGELRFQLFIFNLFVVVFVFVMAYVLGKIFLKPLKHSLVNLENFIRDATHEMNTPLSVILTNIEMLKMKNINSKELERIEFSAKRLEKIFNDLAFIRLNHTKKRNIQKINLKEIINERIKFFSTLSENKNIKLKTEYTDNVFLEADREDIVRIVDNLLSNSIKYSPVNKTVYINLNKGVLNVSNSGEIKNINKAVSKFYRENKDEGGFGLGLYIVKKICDYYGFEFLITSEKETVSVSVKMKERG